MSDPSSPPTMTGAAAPASPTEPSSSSSLDPHGSSSLPESSSFSEAGESHDPQTRRSLVGALPPPSEDSSHGRSGSRATSYGIPRPQSGVTSFSDDDILLPPRSAFARPDSAGSAGSPLLGSRSHSFSRQSLASPSIGTDRSSFFANPSDGRYPLARSSTADDLLQTSDPRAVFRASNRDSSFSSMGEKWDDAVFTPHLLTGGGDSSATSYPPNGGFETGKEDDDWLHGEARSRPSSRRRAAAAAEGGASTAGQQQSVNEKFVGSQYDDELAEHPDGFSALLTRRGLSNFGCLALLVLALLTLFAFYPIWGQLHSKKIDAGFVNSTTSSETQTPSPGPMSGDAVSKIGSFGLIDSETPQSALTHKGLTGVNADKEYELVFSDEFEVDGRTFFAGEDPYWEAVDLHYWATENLEWYDPRMLTTKGGSLVVTLNKTDPATNHNLDYMGGMMSTWNKFCFTGGYIESRVRLPGTPKIGGLWPALWAMGNLGRAGYGGTLDGMWPYTYDSCDVGTLPNQTLNNGPTAALTSGKANYNYALSYLPGQRLSACTCPGDKTHPGPKHANGTWVGRSSPEIDVFEAQVKNQEGHLSMSSQWAPFNHAWQLNNATENYEFYDPVHNGFNTYQGSITQQAGSGNIVTNQNCYEYPANGDPEGCFDIYGFEYKTGSDAYITWVAQDVPAWTLYQAAMGPDPLTEIQTRQISSEPMYLIVNLGISRKFGPIDYGGLSSLWPVTMEIDYIRVYQPKGEVNIGCDPSDRPTSQYIQDHIELYTNPNFTNYAEGGYTFPENRLALENAGHFCAT